MGRRFLNRLLVFILGFWAFLELGGVLQVALSTLVSLAVYALAFGFNFAIGFMALLFVHEMGHIIASRVVGLRASGPMFIPFIGAVVRLNKIPVNSKMAANIAIGGPAAGVVSALVCFVFYLWTDSLLMLVLSYVACILNLFNLIPCAPLDGEHIAAAISHRLMWVGSLVIGLIFVYTHNILIFIIFVFSLIQLWKWRSFGNKEDSSLTRRQRLTVAWWYFGILAVLSVLTWYIMEFLP